MCTHWGKVLTEGLRNRWCIDVFKTTKNFFYMKYVTKERFIFKNTNNTIVYKEFITCFLDLFYYFFKIVFHERKERTKKIQFLVRFLSFLSSCTTNNGRLKINIRQQMALSVCSRVSPLASHKTQIPCGQIFIFLASGY